MATFVQPPRTPSDGAVSVRHPTDDIIEIEVTTNGVTSNISMSTYNATRVFAMLSLMLRIPLSTAVGKAIKL